MFDQATLNSAWGNASASPKQSAQPAKKGPGGIAGFLVNNLPGIASGVGAVAGSFLAPGAGTVSGGAAGGALGEAVKRKLLGQNEDIGQIVTQGVEGGALAGIGGAARGVTNGAKALTKLGTQTAENTAVRTAEDKAGSSFLKNLTTQGQQAQGRVSGISAGSKVAGNELVPQDTARMLDTLQQEGIKTGNANNTLRDITDKMKGYGQQISDHFTANNAPLLPGDTKQIATNFLSGLKTTDPGVLKQAQIVADDLQKNVKSTKDLWEFRKTLDSKIPDSKFMDEATTNKVTALKAARQYIADELGSVPGAQNYHSLAEIKPFVSKEANRLNNPSGGIVGRVMSAGPVQSLENTVGKATEKIGNIGTKTANQSVDTMNPAVNNQNILQRIVGATANPVANPGQTGRAVLKQEAGRGFGVPASITQAAQSNQPQEPDISSAITQASAANPDTSNDPFAPENVQANVQAILQQGGKQSDVSAYLANVKAYQALTEASTPKLNATQQQQANNANSGLKDIQSLSGMLSKDPSLTLKSALPGGSITQRLAGTTDYEAAKNNIVDVISRLRSGAAISASEEKLYKSLLPSAGDSAESANSKLGRLANLLGSFANPGTTSGSDITDLLANSGAQ